MSKRKLIDDRDARIKKQRGEPELDFSAMPFSSELLKIQHYDVALDIRLYSDLQTSMRTNIKNLHSLYKQISHKSLVRTVINSIQKGNDDPDYIGYNLALFAEMGESGDAIKQVIEAIADQKLKAKSIGAGLCRLAKVQSDAAVIKRALDVIEDQSLKIKSVAIGLYLLFKDEGPMAVAGHLLDEIKDHKVTTCAINMSLTWLCKDMSAVSKVAEVLTDSNVAQPVIIADEDVSGLLGESSAL